MKYIMLICCLATGSVFAATNPHKAPVSKAKSAFISETQYDACNCGHVKKPKKKKI